MHNKPLAALLILGLVIGTALSIGAAFEVTNATGVKGLSIVTIEPDAAETLRAQGRTFRYPFPNSANKGKKFNPSGSTIGSLVTAPEQKIIVIFVEFTTLPPGGPDARLDLHYFDNMLFGTIYDPPEYLGQHPTDRTLKNYWTEVSYRKVNIATKNMPSSLGWKQSGKPYDYYCKADGVHDNGFGPYPQNAQGLVIDAIKAVDSYVDFSQYAVDGQVPNLFVVHAGTGAEWSAAPNIIWSHSWDLTEGTGLDGYVADGVKLNNYAMMPEVGGDLTGYLGMGVIGPFPPTVGVYAHEYGHVLGLPDQYDYGYKSTGTGIYSPMASGSWNRYPDLPIFSGNTPSDLDAWSKYRLGFVAPTVVTSLTSVNLPPAETDPVVYKMVVPNSGGKEYFLLENRQQIGFDKGRDRTGYWDAHGLAIYHVDDTVFNRNYWFPNEAENWKEFRSEGWRKAWTGETHYAISIIQADDRWDLEHARNVGDSRDLYPGQLGVHSFGSKTRPNSSNYYFWSGSTPKFGYSGVTVNNIQETGNTVTADVSFVP
jgi:immune inhibitor A